MFYSLRHAARQLVAHTACAREPSPGAECCPEALGACACSLHANAPSHAHRMYKTFAVLCNRHRLFCSTRFFAVSVTLSVHFYSLFAFSRSNMMSSSVTRSAPVAQRSVVARAVSPAAHNKVMAAARGVFVTASAAAMLCAWNPAPAEAIVKSPTQKGAERVQGFQLQNARLQKAFEVQQKSSPAVTAQAPVCSYDRPRGIPHPLKQYAE